MKRFDISLDGHITEAAKDALGDFVAHATLLALGWSVRGAGVYIGGFVGESLQSGAFIFFAVMFVSLVMHTYQQHQIFKQAIATAEHQREMEKKKLELTEPPKPAPVARVEFPPERFVTYLWQHRQEFGTIPTVDKCTTDGKFNRGLVQKWFEEMVNAGAIAGRVEGNKNGQGDFVAGWTFERCAEASRRANTTPALTR